KLLQQYGTQRHYAHAVVTADPFLEKIRQTEGVLRADYAGEMRRNLEIVSRVEVVAGASDKATAAHGLAQWIEPTDDASTFSGKLPDGLPLILYLVEGSSFGTELWRRTGSDRHVEAFEERFGRPSELTDEKDLYDAAGLSFIPPEIREHDGELDAASDGIPNLITEEDIRGSLHNHSTYSDGAHTLRQMVEAARSIGYSYYAACDHSQSLVIANGMTADRVRKQQAEIRKINEEIAAAGSEPFRVFSGIESDILYDGSLDYPTEVLATFDIVVASVHSRFNMARDEATERIVRAVENPYTTILGHPTGRLLLRREGYPIDHARVIDACSANGVSIEINANPRRLDIDWRWVRRATDRGVLIAIDPDAHSIDELYYMRWGVAIARKGWLEPEQCLNAKSLDAFTHWLDAMNRRRAAVTQL
ncbi:MAG: PHP domain-containing protein, partial [Rhodothermales bacterium]